MTARRLALAIVLGAAGVRIVLSGVMPLFPDEAYYWEWSRHLAAGYFDHPPGIAFVVRAGTSLFAAFDASNTTVAVRLGAVLSGLIAALATAGIARRLAGDEAALRASIIMTVLPLAAAGLVLATPEAPALAAVAVALYCVVAALAHQPRTRASLRWWTLTGVALGIAFVSKYTAILVPVGVVLAFALRRDLRARFTEAGPYVACVVATVIFLPVLLWNARHNWISFTHQIQHGLGAPQGPPVMSALRHEGDYVAGQAGLATPILFVFLVMAIARGLRRVAQAAEFVLAVVALGYFALFMYSALRQHVEPNWPGPGYIPAIALVAATVWGPRAATWFHAGVALAAAVSVLVYVQAVVPILPVPPPRDPVARAFGWEDLAHHAVADARVLTLSTSHRTWLGADRYQEAAELAFHDPDHAATFAVNLTGRANQYDLWPRFPNVAARGDNLILVLDNTDGAHPAAAILAPHFAAVRRGDRLTLTRQGGVVGERREWLLVGWNGGWP